MSSELSDIDSDDGEDIEPDHYFEGGKIPVFKPVRYYVARELELELVCSECYNCMKYYCRVLTSIKQTMDQFRNFKRFIDKIDKHGMKSGIVKVIPPAEW